MIKLAKKIAGVVVPKVIDFTHQLMKDGEKELSKTVHEEIDRHKANLKKRVQGWVNAK